MYSEIIWNTNFTNEFINLKKTEVKSAKVFEIKGFQSFSSISSFCADRLTMSDKISLLFIVDNRPLNSNQIKNTFFRWTYIKKCIGNLDRTYCVVTRRIILLFYKTNVMPLRLQCLIGVSSIWIVDLWLHFADRVGTLPR